jgi:phage shock protein PspC (stress-responsive transcriptional regulator)
MDKTIKINLGGTLFQIDEEAYKMLRRYLHEIDSRLGKTQGGAETIDDIESRIAEIFQSQKGIGVITRENVEAMIALVGKPEDFDIGNDETRTNEPSYQSTVQKKLYRNPEDTIISGVSGGIGAYLNVESVWIRILFVLFACFFLVGLLIYIALWIALPYARSEGQKREMYGNSNINTSAHKKSNSSLSRRDYSYSAAGSGGSPAGNAVNEIFRAIGKVLYVILRIFLIIIGITFVITGFITLVTFIMIFFFKYPGYFSTDSFGVNLFYFPDFLDYIVNPGVAPWILILTFIAVLMPLLALIYWGVKMIFWFKAKDWVVSLIGLVVWVSSVAALSLLLFSEGISYTETGRTATNEIIDTAPGELYILSDKKVSELNYDKEISLPDEDYNIWFVDGNKGLYITSNLDVYKSEDTSVRLNVRKRSMGHSKTDAARKSEELLYNYRITGDTILLDEYFTVPANRKWSFDQVRVRLYIPEGTVIHFDSATSDMFRHSEYHDWDSDSDDDRYVNSDRSWEMTDDGLRRLRDRSDNKE